MSASDTLARLRAWEDWANVHLDPQGLPSPISDAGTHLGKDERTRALIAPWHLEVPAVAQDLVDDVEDNCDSLRHAVDTLVLSPVGDPRITRFVIVNLLYALASHLQYHLDSDEAETVWADEIDEMEAVQGFLEDLLTDIVRLVPPTAVRNDAVTLAWEISAAFVIGDWNRARQVFDRSDALPPSEAGAMRAARGLMEVFLADPDLGVMAEKYGRIGWFAAFWWLPGRAPIEQVAENQDALLYVWSSIDKATKPSEPWEGVEAALGYLDGTTSARTARLARAFRGKALFLGWRFAEAAAAYEKLAEETTDQNAAPPNYGSIVRCYQEAEDFASAETWVDKWASSRGGDEALSLLVAELRAAQGDYAGAYRKVREVFADRDEVQPVEWKTATLLALGGVTAGRADTAKLDALLAAHPKVSQRIRSLLSDYWPTFDRLDARSQILWEQGLHYLLWGEAPPGYEEGLRQDAASRFAKVLERELRSRVFVALREEVTRSVGLRTALASSKANKELQRFLMGESQRLTLGPMEWLIRHGGIPESKRFFIERFQGLRETSRELASVIEFRNPAAHGDDEAFSHVAVGQACRKILDIVFRSIAQE